MAKRLVKSADKKLFGVAGGLAEYFDIDPVLVRVGVVVASIITFPLGPVAYGVLAIIMPSPPRPTPSGSSGGQTTDNSPEGDDDAPP